MSTNSKFLGIITIIILVGVCFSIKAPVYNGDLVYANNMSCFSYEKKCYFEEGNCGEKINSCSGVRKPPKDVFDMVVPKKSRGALFNWLAFSVRLVITILIAAVFNKMVFDFIKPIKLLLKKRRGRILVNRAKTFTMVFILSCFLVAMPVFFYFVMFVV